MLRPKVLPKILEQSVSEGVISALLITTEGDLLATSGGENDKVIAAIVSNIWSSYHKVNKVIHCLLLECEHGNLAVTKVSQFVLCIYGNKNSELGMLKSKMDVLYQYLEPSLNKLR